MPYTTVPALKTLPFNASNLMMKNPSRIFRGLKRGNSVAKGLTNIGDRTKGKVVPKGFIVEVTKFKLNNRAFKQKNST